MRSHRRPALGWAVFVLAVALAAAPAAGGELTTSIDVNYTYQQQNQQGDVTATTQYFQKYVVKYETTVTSSLDFLGAVTLELDDKWQLDAAATSRVSPSLELGVKGAQSAVKLTYAGIVSTTEQFRESDESVSYSNNTDLSVELMPNYWPELKLKLSERREYLEQKKDGTSTSAQLQLRDQIFNVQLDFSLKFDNKDDVLPRRATSDRTEWSWKATYKEVLYGGTEFELDYEIKETYTEATRRGQFASADETYSQGLKTRLKNSLDLTPLLSVGLSWEYAAEQDLLQLEYDYSVDNKYLLDVRYDMFPALKLSGVAQRETELEVRTEGHEDKQGVSDSIRAAFAFSPVGWLRLGGRADWKSKGSMDEGTGGSVDRDEEEGYELVASTKLGEHLDLAVDGSFRRSYSNGSLDSRLSKFKAGGKYSYEEFTVESSFTASHDLSWTERGELEKETASREVKVKFGYKLQLLDLLIASFSHDYTVKVEQELDEVLDYDSELQMSENTSLALTVDELFDGLRIEGEIQRSGTDTEGDEDPQLVEVAYSLKLDWKFDTLTLNSTLKYSDKGDKFDDVSVSTKVSWKIDAFDLQGGYEFSKTYADETDEGRGLNLRLTYKF